MPETSITTDLDMHELAQTVGTVLPASFMEEVFFAYRLYRHEIIKSKRQLHDLSPMKPLAPATIKQKRGQHDRVTKYVNRKGKASVWKRSGPSPTPDIPLMDTGNMASPQALDHKSSPGHLEIWLGPTRAEIGAYHQAGDGHLPQRVHLSWNEEFVYNHPHGVAALLAAYYKTTVQKIAHHIRMY